MRISVVVATFNRSAQLRSLLETLFRQDVGANDYEIIVVIDGSTDDTQAMLDGLQAPCGMRVMRQANAGQAAARNAGWRAARAPVALFLDDDLECPPDLLSNHLRIHDHASDRVGVGRVATAAEGRPSVALDLVRRQLITWESRMAQSPGPRWPDDAYVSTNCSVPTRMLELVGGFDPAFYRALEDHDLGLRLWEIGAHFVYLPDAVVRQRYTKSSADAVGDEVWYGQAEVLLGRKHPALLQYGQLARVSRLPRLRWCLLRVFAASPSAASVLLGVPVRIMDSMSVPQPVMALGRRLLGAWMQATRLRAAVDAMGGWAAFDATFSRRVAVLMYHHVGPHREGTYPSLTVSPGTFERQIRWLARRGYSAITPSQYLAWRLGRSKLPERPLLVTFDDGYADIAEHAFPVLERYGFGSCVFIVTGELAGTNSWDRVRGSATHQLLSAEQIRQWQHKGVEFGGHSRHHPSLPSLGRGEIHEEIAGCRADLQQLVGFAPVAFAYPYGEFDSRAVEEARAAFLLAFSCEEGMNSLGTDPHLLRRTMVMSDDSRGVILMRATLGYSRWDVLRRWRATAVRPLRRILNRVRGAGLDAA